MKIDKKIIKEVVENVVECFDKEHIESPMYKHLIEKSEYLKDPDEMQTMIIYPFIRCVELAIQKSQNKNPEIVNLWMNYDFLERNVSELCSKFYGGGCSVDRGRFIVKSFIKFKETGIMPKLNWKQEYTFHYPKKGSLKQWFNFVEGIDRLQYGYNDVYLKSLFILIKVHKESKK